MIVFISTDGHGHTVKSLVEDTSGAPAPVVRQTTYDAILKVDQAPEATYIFADLERLYPWERVLAGHLFRVLKREGFRCLNDPARVLGRFELLAALHRAGHNPFRAYRADEAPRPRRFPVFVRVEADHLKPITGLIDDQAGLDSALEKLASQGIPRSGLLVIEFCAEPIAAERWRRWGTFRIGGRMHTDHCVIEDSWLVKHGALGLASDTMFDQERKVIEDNPFAACLEPVFAIANIEYGRADHAEVNGKQVVYEINTNPDIKTLTPHPRSKVRTDSMLMARRKLIESLAAIDTGSQLMKRFRPTSLMASYARRNRDRQPLIRP